MKAYWRRRGIDPRNLDLGTRWRWVVNFAPLPLYPQEKNPWYPLDRWAPEPVWTRWWREKFPAPVGTRTLDHPAPSPALYHWVVPTPVRHARRIIKSRAVCLLLSLFHTGYTKTNTSPFFDVNPHLLRFTGFLKPPCQGCSRLQAKPHTQGVCVLADYGICRSAAEVHLVSCISQRNPSVVLNQSTVPRWGSDRTDWEVFNGAHSEILEPFYPLVHLPLSNAVLFVLCWRSSLNLGCFTLSDHKNRITSRCSTTAQSDTGADRFTARLHEFYWT
jgi:hypothetical protein